MQPAPEMRLYSPKGQRLYLNAGERERFRQAALRQTIELRLFCLVLLYTGSRISEALALRRESFQTEAQCLSIICLKKRRLGIVREVPVPLMLFDLLAQLPETENQLWLWHRSTAWRKVKTVMAEADVIGPHAVPKGLRHGFGVNAVQCAIPLNMLAKWMGHASLRTTAIYATPIGSDEIKLASNMWRCSSNGNCGSALGRTLPRRSTVSQQ